MPRIRLDQTSFCGCVKLATVQHVAIYVQCADAIESDVSLVLARPINILVTWRIWLHAVFLHVRHHLVGNFGENFFRQHHLTAIEVAAESAADELAERHELKTQQQQRHEQSYTDDSF